MSIRADVIRGHTDAVILAQLLRRDSYGYEINKTIEKLFRRRIRPEGGHALYRLPAAGGQRVHYLLLGR